MSFKPYEVLFGKFMISDDPDRLVFEDVFRFLHEEAYWCRGIPREVLARACSNSLCIGAYLAGQQAAFARVVTDRAEFAYLCDVFVLPPYRGQGLGKALVAAIMDHPDLQNLRRFTLVSRDARELYTRFGFQSPKEPQKHLEISIPAAELWGTEQ